MAHHQSAIKRIRQTKVRKARNKYFGKTTRNLIRDLRATKDKAEAETLMPKVVSMIDRQVRRNQFHRNKAANLKAKLAKYVNAL